MYIYIHTYIHLNKYVYIYININITPGWKGFYDHRRLYQCVLRPYGDDPQFFHDSDLCVYLCVCICVSACIYNHECVGGNV